MDRRGDELVVEMEVGVKLSVRCAMWGYGEEEKSYREMIRRERRNGDGSSGKALIGGAFRAGDAYYAYCIALHVY